MKFGLFALITIIVLFISSVLFMIDKGCIAAHQDLGRVVCDRWGR